MGDAFVTLRLRQADCSLSMFQSPSHGGRLRDAKTKPATNTDVGSFSPLPMGDAFVTIGTPFHEGACLKFQTPSHGGRLRDYPVPWTLWSETRVSVPFPWGTPS